MQVVFPTCPVQVVFSTSFMQNEVEKRGGWEKKTKKEWRRMREERDVSRKRENNRRFAKAKWHSFLYT